MPIAPGTHLGPYVVQESIGQGAMGVVYRAYHAELERTGAVKVLQALSPDEETTARFRREAQAIAHMRHPNVLNVFDFGACEGVPYMIVEYVDGGSLAARIRRSDLTPEQALHYLRGIAAALDYAHSLGIVHRDVKPANVLLAGDDTPILADFGLAKLLQSSSIKSITGVTTGTPAYMAPEQVTGSDVGPAADRYSLAVMAFEMLCGSLPFDDVGVLEVLYAHVHREPPQPSARNAALTKRVDAIILRGLAKDPQSRWESCDAFVSALERAIVGSAPAVAQTIVAAPPAPAAVAPPAAAAPAPEKRKRRYGFLWVAAALILLLLISTAAVFVFNRPSLDVRPTTVAVGGRISVIATHVPKGQVGEIQIHSAFHAFAFRADASGNVSRDIDLPADIQPGDHEVDLCWSLSCHARQTLHVVAGGVAEVTPGTTPSASPSSTPSPSTSPRATPGKSPTPKPTGNPTSNPTHSPSATPSTRPNPSPTPTTNPCPGNSSALALSPASQTITLLGGTAKFTGSNFTPNSSVTVSYKKGSNAAVSLAPVKATCGGGISVSVAIAGSVARTDYITVCDVTKGCVTETVTVL